MHICRLGIARQNVDQGFINQSLTLQIDKDQGRHREREIFQICVFLALIR